MTVSGLVAHVALDTHQPSPDAAWRRTGVFAGFVARGPQLAMGLDPAIRAIPARTSRPGSLSGCFGSCFQVPAEMLGSTRAQNADQ